LQERKEFLTFSDKLLEIFHHFQNKKQGSSIATTKLISTNHNSAFDSPKKSFPSSGEEFGIEDSNNNERNPQQILDSTVNYTAFFEQFVNHSFPSHSSASSLSVTTRNPQKQTKKSFSNANLSNAMELFYQFCSSHLQEWKWLSEEYKKLSGVSSQVEESKSDLQSQYQRLQDFFQTMKEQKESNEQRHQQEVKEIFFIRNFLLFVSNLFFL
jgi:hypothetical protein